MISTNTFAQRALQLSEQGYTTIPLSGKRPVTVDWQKLRKVTAEQIADWERQGYYKNLGMVCGAASNNTVVIDFDGLQGYELMCDLYPSLKDTLTVATGSGKGMHVYFKVDLLPDSMGSMGIPDKDGELFNIEIKSDGKQVVIPPSIHPDTGKAYVKVIDKPIKHVTDLAEMIAWIKLLKPQDSKPQQTSTGDLNPKLLAAVESYFLAQDHKIRGVWIDCACPNTLAHKNGDKHFSFGYNTEKHFGHCLTCEGGKDYLIKELCPMIGIDPASYGGLYEKTETAPYTVKIAQNNGVSQNGNGKHDTVQIVQSIPVVVRSSRLNAYSKRLYDYETKRESAPVPFPFAALHQYGGMARVIKPGKLIGVVGVSGGGKTSLLESMVDSWLGFRVPSLVWSPEWDGDEFIERSVQRYGGVSAEELYLHDIYIWELQNGVKHGAGVELNLDQQKRSDMAIRTLRGWQDEVGYLDCPFLTVGHLQASIEATLKAIDFTPRVLVIDYVQLLHAMEENSDLTMYNLLMRIKAICRAYDLVGVIATQVTKESARGQAGGQVLDSMAARYVNDDAFNLFVTVNPDRDEKGLFMPSAVLNVAKNSMGRRGKVRVGVHWDKLLFDSKAHHNQRFPEDEKADDDE